MLPLLFEDEMQKLLGPEAFTAFIAAMKEAPPVSIRLNPAKATDDNPPVVRRRLQAVPWHPHGFYLPERPVFTLDPLFHAGAYYVQEASSMFLHEALRQTVDFSKSLKMLDLCAAPGGKSTLMADMLTALPPRTGLLVANEVIQSRIGVLRENLEKWGSPNLAVTCAEAGEFAALENFFDVVVADAPCSGEGMFRKNPDAAREWSPAHVALCSGRQQRILAAAVATLRPGGILAYSTCTYNRAENENNVFWLAQNFDLDLLRLKVPVEWGIVETEGGYRFFPQRLRGEGFFIAVFRKKEGIASQKNGPSGFKNLKPLARNLAQDLALWLKDACDFRFFQTPSGTVLALSAALEAEYLVLDKYMKTKWFGVEMGTIKGKDLAPSHALALSAAVSSTLPALELDREHALRFLKKESFDAPAGTPPGWTLARYRGLNLGWLKILPNRLNNYLPPERRIRMHIGPDSY